MKFTIVLVSLLFSVLPSLAEQTATTADGKTVLLKDNGTWEYVSPGKPESAPPENGAAPAGGSLFEVIKTGAQYDFRSVKWGMNKKAVLAAEDARLLKNEGNTLSYEMSLFGYQCRVEYRFTAEQLTDAILHIRQEHIDPELFYQDYENLKKQLVPVFGENISNKCDWKNDMYRSERAKWGFAVSLGFLTCRTLWKTPRTTITLSIAGSNHLITTTMEYGYNQ